MPPRSVPRPLGHSQSANYLFAPKPYNSPDSSQNNFRNVLSNQNGEKHSVPEVAETKTVEESEGRPPVSSVRDRINLLNNKPSQSTPDRPVKNSPNNVGNLKRSYEEQQNSPLVPSHDTPSSRRSYEPPPTTGSKLSSSFSESRLARSARDNVLVPDIASKSPEMSRTFTERRDSAQSGPLSPRRTSFPTESRRPNDRVPPLGVGIESRGQDSASEFREPPPVDRSAAGGYPGSIYRRDSFQNRRASADNSVTKLHRKDSLNGQMQSNEHIGGDIRSNPRTDSRTLENSGSNLQALNSNTDSNVRQVNRDHRVNENEDNLKSDKNSNFVSSPQKSAKVRSESSSNLHNVHNRQPSAEELECDAKVQEFANQFKDKDPKLSTVLKTDNINRMQYMDGLFQVDVEITSRHSPKTSPKSSSVSQNSSLIEQGDFNKTPEKDKDEMEKGDQEKR